MEPPFHMELRLCGVPCRYLRAASVVSASLQYLKTNYHHLAHLPVFFHHAADICSFADCAS